MAIEPMGTITQGRRHLCVPGRRIYRRSVSLSVIIVTLGEEPRLQACVRSLLAAGPSGVEVIVVQNGVVGPIPKDERLPIKRLRRTENLGFSEAFNRGLELASSEWILSLNPDVIIEPGAIAQARQALESSSEIAAVAFRLLRPDRMIMDSAGIRLGFVRRARDRGMGRPALTRFLDAADVDAACMACALFRRSALEAVRDPAGDVLDERFFAYKEDVDLGWRLRRLGYRIRYEPKAVALHERGWKEGARRSIPGWIRRLSLRNRWLMIAKNETLFGFLLRLAPYFLTEVMIVSYLLVREPAVLRAYVGIGQEIARSWQRRQSGRRGKAH